MPGKQLHVNLRQYPYWTVQELASALEISEEEARERIEDLLALEVISGDEQKGFEFNEIRREMRVTVIKESGIVALIDAFERWKFNRMYMKAQKQAVKNGKKYLETYRLMGPRFMRDRYTGRY